MEKINPRPTTQTTLAETKKNMPDAAVSGHPDNYFNSIFRISRDDKYFRALDVMPVKNGGLVVQSSWLEDGKPALSFFYDPFLRLEEKIYHDASGKSVKGYIIVDRRCRYRILGVCVLLVAGILLCMAGIHT